MDLRQTHDLSETGSIPVLRNHFSYRHKKNEAGSENGPASFFALPGVTPVLPGVSPAGAHCPDGQVFEFALEGDIFLRF